MINIWNFEYCGKVKIVDIDGNEFTGEAQEITDESERSDDEKAEVKKKAEDFQKDADSIYRES